MAFVFEYPAKIKAILCFASNWIADPKERSARIVNLTREADDPPFIDGGISVGGSRGTRLRGR